MTNTISTPRRLANISVFLQNQFEESENSLESANEDYLKNVMKIACEYYQKLPGSCKLLFEKPALISLSFAGSEIKDSNYNESNFSRFVAKSLLISKYEKEKVEPIELSVYSNILDKENSEKMAEKLCGELNKALYGLASVKFHSANNKIKFSFTVCQRN